MQQNVEGFDKYYAELTPSQQLLWGKLGWFDIYHVWYFNALLLILSLNIVLASIDRFPKAWTFISRPKLDAGATWLKGQEQPGSFDAQVNAAAAYQQVQRYREAIEFLKRANQLRPNAYEPIVNLGNAHFDSNLYEDAERWYTAALKINPDDVNVRTDLGLTFFFRNPPDIDRAIKEYRASLERDPVHPQTLQNLLVALIKKGDVEESQAVLAKLQGG